MVLKRNNFNTEEEYMKYTRSDEFLSHYSIENKTVNEVCEDMCLPMEWSEYVQELLPVLLKHNRISGYDLIAHVEDLVEQREDGLSIEEVKELEEAKNRGRK
ncbi:hypothetical protein E2L07_16125 [Halalkalibacterium halodurans]|uniref:hypothetical protein n=1 Tax=Halalkalibacterium halodurans TaxID=86665 RepID=UPI00106727A4|nr:hypothetical protein [Halalkalibacterium halodurans]TES50318.1 hypothetical protein E2L07_16125 [Halalkalibacterium halodurans]